MKVLTSLPLSKSPCRLGTDRLPLLLHYYRGATLQKTWTYLAEDTDSVLDLKLVLKKHQNFIWPILFDDHGQHLMNQDVLRHYKDGYGYVRLYLFDKNDHKHCLVRLELMGLSFVPGTVSSEEHRTNTMWVICHAREKIGHLRVWLRIDGYLKINPAEAVYLHIDNVIPMIGSYAKKYKNSQGYISMTLTKEDTFG